MVMVYLEPKQESRCSKWGYSGPRISKCGLMECHYFSCVPSHSKCVMHAFPHTLGLGHYSFLKWHTENVCLKFKKKKSWLHHHYPGCQRVFTSWQSSCQWAAKLWLWRGEKGSFRSPRLWLPCSLIAALPWKKKPLPPIVHCDWQRRQIFY